MLNPIRTLQLLLGRPDDALTLVPSPGAAEFKQLEAIARDLRLRMGESALIWLPILSFVRLTSSRI